MEIRKGKSHKDKLRTRVDGRRLEREMILARVQERMDRERQAKEALDIVPNLEFWCVPCKLDFIGFGYKQVRRLQDGTTIAWWYGHCPKLLHRAIRRITDKQFDDYYYQSQLVLRQAQDFAEDIMSPHDPRFALRYPKAYERWQTDNGEHDPGETFLTG